MCCFQNAKVDVKVIAAERLDELLSIGWERMKRNEDRTGLLTHIDEIGPTFREIQLGDQRDRLCYLRTDGFFIWAGKGDHCGYQLRLESFLVRERDRVLVLRSC